MLNNYDLNAGEKCGVDGVQGYSPLYGTESV